MRSDFTQFTGLPSQNLISFFGQQDQRAVALCLPWLAYLRTHDLHAKGLPTVLAKTNLPILLPKCMGFHLESTACMVGQSITAWGWLNDGLKTYVLQK